MSALSIKIDAAPLMATADELLKAGKLLELVDGGLLRRFKDALAGRGVDELCAIGDMRADPAGDFLLAVVPSEFLLSVIAALRTAQGDADIVHG